MKIIFTNLNHKNSICPRFNSTSRFVLNIVLNIVPANPEAVATDVPLVPSPSKKYLKKMEKRAKYEDIKKLKRKAEKQKLKLKRLQAKETGDLMPIPRKLLIKTVAPVDFAAQSARVCIDVSFDDKMTEAEKRKTSKQLLRVYTLNRRAPKPMPVYFCGMKPDTEMYKIFEKNDGFQHWDVSKAFYCLIIKF